MRAVVFSKGGYRIAMCPTRCVIEEGVSGTIHVRVAGEDRDGERFDCTFDEAVAELTAALRDDYDVGDLPEDDGFDPLGLADGLPEE